MSSKKHNRMVDRQKKGRDGRWIDPVTKKPFPKGVRLVKNPTKAMKEALKKWREAQS